MTDQVISKFIAPVALLFATLMLGNAAHAQDARWYGGAGFGQVDTDDSDFDDSDTAVFYFGREFETYAIEAALVDLGEFDFRDFRDTYVEINGFEISALGFLTLNESFDLFGKAGIYFWDLESVAFGDTFEEEDGSSFALGFGARYNFNETFGARLELINYYDIEDADLDTANLGVYVRF